MTDPDRQNPSAGTEARSPRDEYGERLARARAAATRLSRQDGLIANSRVAAFALIIAVGWVALATQLFPAWFALLPAAAFIWLLVYHERVVERLTMEQRRVSIYDDGIARIDDRWMGRGRHGKRYGDPAHPYARDIDLFGEGSLYELLCTARSRPGADTLARWLCKPAGLEAVRARQDAVRELAPQVDFRERIMLLGQDLRGDLTIDALAGWGDAPGLSLGPWQQPLAGLLGILNVAACVYGVMSRNALPLVISFLLTLLFSRICSAAVGRAANALRKSMKDLTSMADLLAVIERQELHSPLLLRLQQVLVAGGPASACIARLDRLADLYEAPANAILGPVAALVLWRFHFACAIERWRRRHGARLRDWAVAAGEIEALCSLASFRYENPASVFPDMTAAPPQFHALALAHPLLPRTTRVANDVSIDSQHPLLIVSGSNMSGKSTLLRTIGCTIALAFAGAPVIAGKLTVSPLQVGASIRTEDSLLGGVSRFYAEIKRIREIVDLAGGGQTLLFLLDEMLQGTNSHDRRVGAEAVLRSLVRAGALGLVTTHDLALAKLADQAEFGAANVHLEDQIIDGKMVFDYRLRQGVVTKSNAIALMRAVGLEL